MAITRVQRPQQPDHGCGVGEELCFSCAIGAAAMFAASSRNACMAGRFTVVVQFAVDCPSPAIPTTPGHLQHCRDLNRSLGGGHTVQQQSKSGLNLN
jgi:hypothetical protein